MQLIGAVDALCHPQPTPPPYPSSFTIIVPVMADPNFEESPNLLQEKDSREDLNSPTSPSHNDSVDSSGGEKDPAHPVFIDRKFNIPT